MTTIINHTKRGTSEITLVGPDAFTVAWVTFEGLRGIPSRHSGMCLAPCEGYVGALRSGQFGHPLSQRAYDELVAAGVEVRHEV